MRLLIVSDLHANAAALEQVSQEADAVVVLGDLVDYGPDPEATIKWVREYATYAVRGNHDDAVASNGPTFAGGSLAWVAEETETRFALAAHAGGAGRGRLALVASRRDQGPRAKTKSRFRPTTCSARGSAQTGARPDTTTVAASGCADSRAPPNREARR